MIYWLATNFEAFWREHGLWTYVNVFRYQTFRTSMAAVTAFLLTMLISPRIIRLLVRLRVGSSVDFDQDRVNELYATKGSTPTMGGLIIVAAMLLSTLLWDDVSNFYVFLGMLTVVWLAALGFVDDYLKMVAKSRGGLKSWEKLVFQVGLAVILGAFLWKHGSPSIQLPPSVQFDQLGKALPLSLPFWKHPLALTLPLFMIVSVAVVAGTSNAVNLADGMDGLASGAMAIVTMVFLAVTYVAGRADYSMYLLFPHVPGAGELTIFCGAILGAALGFLWFNCHPARVFMGDTGSLPLGGAIGLVALVTRQEMLLFVVGGVFVMEALSVILQVGYFKLSGGKRIFLMTPIHHHFQLKGWTETQTVVRFWLIGAMCAALALATLKLR
ncbi:MAG: phospho-N-acetylmuramoyl-pentapeptide-transferase [Anaerolineaceae bacterium]|nr:phospho-N-acetylmuramoyl-pentapeptide-transferase [Anaerolineaceae bacterium]